MESKLKRVIFAIGFTATALVFLTGSATIISGTNQPLTFQSEPEGAQVFVDGMMIGVTPVTVNVPKNKRSTYTMQKDGYETVTRDITKAYDPVAILSIFWDLSTTDLISGAAFEYEPNSYFVTLTPNQN